MESTLPVTILNGVRVLEIGVGVASGWCGRLFSWCRSLQIRK